MALRSFGRPGCRWGTAVLLVLVGSGGCGARDAPTGTRHGPPLEAGVTYSGCLGDLDCGPLDLCNPVHCIAGACVPSAPVVCDDGDDCTEDRCVPETGDCENRALSLDEDGDGHNGPRPGYRAGDPGACGDDCDDTSPLASPGNREQCDGVDNDCNGVVDDGANYVPSFDEPLLLSPGARQAGIGGIAFAEGAFAVALAEQNESWDTTFTAFDAAGAITVTSTSLTHVNTDTFAGPLVWTGSMLASAWEDRRDGDFEIYFNRFDTKGQKLGPDVRVTNAPEFSLRPDVLWDGAEFVVVWQDRRDDPDAGRIYGQRIDPDGALVGGNVALTPLGVDADAPGIAQSDRGFGLVCNEKDDTGRKLVFRTLSPDLGTVGARVVVGSSEAASSTVAWSGDRYVVAWDTKDSVPGPSILGAALAADGSFLVTERAITWGAPFARSEAIVPLGDRLLFFWAESQGASYSIYTKILSLNLDDQTVPEAVVTDAFDALSPVVSVGPDGTAGMIYESNRTGTFQAYATRLFCTGPSRGPLG